ncbi:MAG: hypothetical protein OXG72_02720 [Acidobacteria bacterium]|nr:hypothetical protein [Acidobacteriota bacterium]
MAANKKDAESWICPGPEWPPDDETCGRTLDHDGRCEDCMQRRTTLRKQAARMTHRLANPREAMAHTAGRGAARDRTPEP